MPGETSSHYCSRCLTSFNVDPEQCPNLACRRMRPSDGWGRIRAPGEVFDRSYQIHRLLAMGGGGITYLVRELDESDNEFGPKLALKALFANREQGAYLRRLATEAQILQEMNHPHIVEYRGFVHRAGRTPYLVTRFEAGGSLLDHVHRVGTLPVRQAAAIGSQICEALHKAHETGVTHRDLKPENVLLSSIVEAGVTPHVRVVDFGIAKVNSSLNSNLTRAGAFVGTPHFASPEQFIGAEVKPTSDIYSVGAMLHFCMMGRHIVQFADRLAPEDGYQLLLDSIPALVNRPDDPPEDVERMNKVLSVVMSARPTDRCTAAELSTMLAAVSSGDDPVLPAPSAPEPAAAPEPAPQPDLNLDKVPTSRPTIDGSSHPTIDHTEEPPAGRGWARGCLLGVGLLAIPAVLVVGGGLYYTYGDWRTPTAPTFDTSLPARTDSGSAAEKEDHRLLTESVVALKPYLQDVCGLPAGTAVVVEVAVGPADARRSTVIDARLTEGSADCVPLRLKTAQLNRATEEALRVTVPLSWP